MFVNIEVCCQDAKERGWSYTPLMHAANQGGEQLVRTLIQHGADINAQDPITQHTALLLAAVSCSYPCVKYLIRCGAKVNVVGFDNNMTPATPVLAAVYYFRLPQCHHLSHEWHSPEGRERSRQQALQLMTLLIQNGCDVNNYGNDLPPLHSSAVCPDTRALLLLLESVAAVDMVTDPARCPQQTTALTEAAMANNIAGVRILIRHGAKVDLPCPEDPWDRNVRSLLTRVLCRKCFEIAELLILVGCHVTPDDLEKMVTFLSESPTGAHTRGPDIEANGGEPRINDMFTMEIATANHKVNTRQMRRESVKHALMFLSQPRPLKWFSRHAIRSGPFVPSPSNIDSLPLPTILKRYIMCYDL